jgi:hypothetical protein
MRMKLLLSGLTIVALGASIVFAHPEVASAETAARSFRVGCKFSHQRRADPIVSPGRRSMHMHDFFGNSSTNARSTYRSMLAASTTCGLSTDTAAYWSPSLVRPSGRLVQPVKMSVAYRNDPVRYRTTRPFPPNFRMIAGGAGTYPHFFWNCARDGSSRKLRRPPECGSDRLVAHLRFPNCSNGRIDSFNHRRHLAYPVRQRCPATHPTKLPFLALNVYYPAGASGPGYELSDGTVAPHMDFWNTWNQTALVGLVRQCLQRGIGCGMQAD